MVNIELFDFKNIIMEAAQIGARKALEQVGFQSDDIRMSEAEKIVKARGHKAYLIQKLREEDMLHFKKRGKAKNSPLMCKKSELIAALAAISAKSIII